MTTDKTVSTISDELLASMLNEAANEEWDDMALALRELQSLREASRTQEPDEQKRYLKDGPVLRLVRLRFFRDLIQSERVKVYEVFGIDKDDLPSPLTLGIEQHVFNQLFVRAASITPPAAVREEVFALREAMVAMSIASALPLVAREYDFQPAMSAVRKVLEKHNG